MNDEMVRKLKIYLLHKCNWYHNDYDVCPTCGLLEKEIYHLLEALDLETGLMDTSGNNYSHDNATAKHSHDIPDDFKE